MMNHACGGLSRSSISCLVMRMATALSTSSGASVGRAASTADRAYASVCNSPGIR